MNMTFPTQQKGVALAVCLIFLVLITIIGVSSLRGTTMNEMMAANAQQKSIAFQASESVIKGVWDHDFVLANTPTTLINPAADTYTTDKNNVLFTTNLSNSAVAITTASATIQYCAETLPEGSELSADLNAPGTAAHVYSFHGISEISAANTAANHDQRGSIERPAAGRKGNCP